MPRTVRVYDEYAFGFSWVLEETMPRTSHALVVDGKVWLVDPVAFDEALDRAAGLGEIAGVLQLLDRHNRDCAQLAARFGVPLLKVPDAVPGTPFKAIPVVRFPGWKETALWWPEHEALIVAEVVGANEIYTGGRGAGGIHPLLRPLPPGGAPLRARHLLMGHGAGVHGAPRRRRSRRTRARGGHPARALAMLNSPAGLGGRAQARPAGLGQPAARDLDRGGQRGRARGLRVVEDRAGGLADAADPRLGAAGVVALGLELDRDVDDAAGVGDEVRRPHDAPLREPDGDPVGGELVVGRAGDHAAAQLRHGVVVEHAAERARRDDVHVGRQRGVRVRPLGAELVGERALALVEVGHDELRARLGEHPGELAADAAEPHHGRCARRASRCRTRARRRPPSRTGRRAPSTGSGRRRCRSRPPGRRRSVASEITAMSRSDVPTSSAVM